MELNNKFTNIARINQFKTSVYEIEMKKEL